MKQAWACLSLWPPIGFTIKVFQGSNQIRLSITKKSSVSSKTPSKCIFPIIFILSTSCILHHHICITSLACFAIMLSTAPHAYAMTIVVRIILYEHIASLTCFSHIASTKLIMLIELDIILHVPIKTLSCLICLRIIILHVHTACAAWPHSMIIHHCMINIKHSCYQNTCSTHVLHDLITWPSIIAW